MVSFVDFVLILLRKRRTSWVILSILSITTVWSWTSQRIFFVPLASRPATTFTNPAKRTPCIGGQTILEHQERNRIHPAIASRRVGALHSVRENMARDDSELVKCLIRARTANEVKITLKKLSVPSNVKNAKVSQVHMDGTSETDGNEMGAHTVGIPFSCLSLNATAAALRRTAHISVFEARSSYGNECTSNANSTETGILIANLVESIGTKLISHRSSLSQKKPHLHELPGVYPLSDILQAFAVLTPNGKMAEKLRPFVSLVVEFLNAHETSDLYKLGPIKLVQCLQAMAKLDIEHSSLYDKIVQRLLKPDALAKLPARFLAHGLSALATFQTSKANRNAANSSLHWKNGGQNDIKGINGNKETDMNARLSRAFMRRLRKPKVKKEASIDDMFRALVATRDLFDLGAMTNMEDDAAIFGFTSLHSILAMRKNSQTLDKSSSPSLLLTPTQVTDMITSWAILSDQRQEDTVIDELLQIWTHDEILERCSIGQMESILHSIRKLNAANNAEVTRRVGERLLVLIEENEASYFQNIYPDFGVEILRWPVFAHRRNNTVMEPFINTAFLLFSSKTFLERSSVKEISNFLWFLSIVECFDEDILLNIGNCLLEESMVDDCSPSIASRILATFTSLLVLEKTHSSESLMELKQDLFYSYGGHLLSSKLSRAEISSALYAYAKANYVQDRGVFDHLVNLLASSREKCSSRQLSQTIWSCGKMIAWERQEMELLDDEDAVMEEPPYLENALNIAIELSTRAEELSPKDVAQIFWGIGRLEILNDELSSAFGNRTIEISSYMNAAEVSNVLWGIAKVQFRDGKLIGSLSDRLAADDVRISSPRVASSILFSLGRLQWKDEIVFQKLSKAMIDQIQDVNAQSVANTLWAFRATRMRPPRELLDTWAVARLGIVPASENKMTN